MRMPSIMALGLVLGLVNSMPSKAAGQFGREQVQRGNGRVCLYQNSNYTGWEQCYNVGDEINSMGDRNSQASSIRIFGRVHVQVWAESGFRGASTEFDTDVPDLIRRAAPEGHTWNDRIRSLRVVSEFDSRDSRDSRDGRDGRIDSRVPNAPPIVANNSPRRNLREGVCVYERANYQGREDCWTPGDEIVDLRRSGLGDRISSIRVFGAVRAMLYERSGFRGERLVVDRDIPDLSRVRMGGTLHTWNDQISSLQIEDERGRGRGRR
jgi:hypothetical protein